MQNLTKEQGLLGLQTLKKQERLKIKVLEIISTINKQKKCFNKSMKLIKLMIILLLIKGSNKYFQSRDIIFRTKDISM